MNPNASAYPHPQCFCGGYQKPVGAEIGLNKREKAILEILGALIIRSRPTKSSATTPELTAANIKKLVKAAIKIADALSAELKGR